MLTPDVLERSRATESFVLALRRFAEGHDVAAIELVRRAPRIKVLRVLAQLLHAAPDLPIERVRLDGRSGCSDFAGTIEVETAHGVRRFDFVWDCRWRAEQEGWRDWLGLPDQIRAAEEFGWRCFAVWSEQRPA